MMIHYRPATIATAAPVNTAPVNTKEISTINDSCPQHVMYKPLTDAVEEA